MHLVWGLQALEGSQWSEPKKKGHLDALRQEVEALRRLRGSLNVATLEDVYEDDTHVHVVTELCLGGELVHRIGSKHYSERTVRLQHLRRYWTSDRTTNSLATVSMVPHRALLQVASYMRAVLRTLAQCHSHHILHRDIKPGEAPDSDVISSRSTLATANPHHCLLCAGNFLLLNDDEMAPLKAIDFGLAVPFKPDELPRSDLGLEGTPW